MKHLLFVLTLFAAFIIQWEGLTWGGVLLSVPNDGAFFGGIVLSFGSSLLGIWIVYTATYRYLVHLFHHTENKL